MKRIKKVLIILLLVFIVTGCSVEYDLTINKDSSVNEKVIATENTKRMMVNTDLDEKTAVNYLYEMFNRQGLDSKLSYVTKEGSTVATVSASHKSLSEYSRNFSSDLFSNVDYIEDGDIVTLVFNQINKIGKDTAVSLIYDEVKVKITLPFKVLKHNADESRYGTYTWNINSGDELRNLSITYDKKTMRDEQKISIGDFSFSIQYQYIAFTIIGLIVLVIVIVVYINNKKNNKV